MMTNSRYTGYSVQDAVRETLDHLTRDQKDHVAGKLGVPYVTLCQWGELKPDGTPRMRIPAEQIGPFCTETNNLLLLHVVIAHTRRPDITSMEQVSPERVMRECTGLSFDLARMFEDGVVTNTEHRRALVKHAELGRALNSINPKVRRRPSESPAFRRAHTLKEAHQWRPAL